MWTSGFVRDLLVGISHRGDSLLIHSFALIWSRKYHSKSQYKSPCKTGLFRPRNNVCSKRRLWYVKQPDPSPSIIFNDYDLICEALSPAYTCFFSLRFQLLFLLLIDVNDWINNECCEGVASHQNISDWSTRSRPSKGGIAMSLWYLHLGYSKQSDAVHYPSSSWQKNTFERFWKRLWYDRWNR